MKTKILSILALLLTVTQGAWAQTTADIGKVIGVDGKYYKTKEAAVNAGTQACAIIAYVGSETGEAGYTGGLAIAMRDANGGTAVQWKNANGTADNPNQYNNIANALSAKESGASLSNGRTNSTTWPAFYHALNNTITTSSGISASKPTSGTSGWFLPSIYQWNIILKALGGASADLSTTGNDSFKPAAVNGKIVDNDARLGNNNYLSSSEIDDSKPWYWWASGGSAASGLAKTNTGHVRAVFAFNTLTAAVYTISYNANGGSGAPDAQTKDGGIDLTLSSDVPTRDGYTFTGWNTRADGLGTSYAAGATCTANVNLTLYAQWVSVNIGKVIGLDGKYYKTKEAAVNAGTEACAIIAYVGSETGETGYTGGLAIAMRDANGGTAVQWKNANGTADNPNQYNNIANALSAKESGASLSNGRNNSTTWPAFYHALNNTITTSSGISASKPTSGTSGWFLPSIYQWNIIMKSLSGVSNNMSTTSSDNFKPAAVNGKIADAGAYLGNNNYLSSSEIDDSKPWYWYAGGGYAASGLNKTHTATVRAVFAFNTLTAAEYTVSYNANGGDGAPDAQTKDGGIDLTLSSTVPTRDGYTFAGWATSAEGAVAYSAGGSYTTDNDIVLYAQWTPTYTATFATGNDNTDWNIEPASCVEGTSVTVSYKGENKVKSVTVQAKP